MLQEAGKERLLLVSIEQNLINGLDDAKRGKKMDIVYFAGKTIPLYKPEVQKPPFGSKGFLIDKKGAFLLEEGPAILKGLACTHSGSGLFEIYDARELDGSGYFPPIKNQDPRSPNGRRIFKSISSQLGMWTLSIGLHHGLLVLAYGGTEGIPTVATLIWDSAPVKKPPQLARD
jgi:hypothetical protein